MSNSVQLEDIIRGGKLDRKAGEEVQELGCTRVCVAHPGAGMFCPWKSEHRASAAGGNGSFHREIQDKHFLGPMPGRMSVVRVVGLIGVEVKAVPRLWTSLLPPVLWWSRYYQPSGPQQRPAPHNSGPCRRLVQVSLWPHLACLVCFPLCFTWHSCTQVWSGACTYSPRGGQPHDCEVPTAAMGRGYVNEPL